MEYKEFEGRTVDEAIVAAMRSFRVSFEELDIKTIAEGSKGIFGLGSKNARIHARLKIDEELDVPAPGEEEEPEAIEEIPSDAPQSAKETPTVHLPDEEMEGIKQKLTDILGLMNIAAEVKVRDGETLEILGDGSGLLIGKHGQTLDSLQFIINRIANKNRQEPVHISIDTERYRERHIEHLQSIALKMGQKAKRTGRSVSLEMMNPYDRRIVHLALKNENGLNTKSIGEGVYKKIIIIPRKSSR